MYFYVISGDSTRFLAAAAHAGYQQELPAGDFPLICTLSSTHHAEKLIIDSEYWMVIGCCKKLARVQHPGGVQALYKQLSCQKHHSEPCFWRSQPSCPPPEVRIQNINYSKAKYGCKGRPSS